MSREQINHYHIEDLLIDFDEMGFVPITACPDPEAYAIEWKEKLINALEDYRKQSEGEWIDNRCSICGKMPMGEEIFDLVDTLPPRFDWFMDFCPNCGAKLKGGK